MEKTKLKRWYLLTVGFVAMMFAGIIYAWSIMKTPFEAYWEATQLGLNYTITVIMFCAGGFFSGIISKKCSATIRLIVSAVMLFSGFLILSRIDGASIIPLYFAHGVLAGFGMGVAYYTIFGTINVWYPDRQGLSIGILITGFGTSAITLGWIADTMGRSEAIGWGKTYLIFAISTGVVMLIAALLLKLPPKGTVLPAPKKQDKAAGVGEVRDHSASEMLRRPLFYVIFISTCLIIFSGNATFSFAKDIFTDIGGTEEFAVFMVGLLAIFNGLGRLVSGWLFDKIGLMKTKIVYGLSSLLAPLTVVAAMSSDSLSLGVAGVCLCVFAYGFTPTANSVFAARYYGSKHYQLNLSIVNMIMIPASFTSTLAGWIKDMTGSFLTAFIIIAAFTAVGSVMVMLLRSRK